MTVYSINKRVLEQSATTSTVANSSKSSEDSAADFMNALQKAASSLFSGAATAGTPSAETALAGHFERKSEQPAQSQTDTGTERTDTTRTDRQATREDRAAARAEKKAAREDARAERAQAKDDDSQTQAVDDQDAPAVADDDETVAVATDDDTVAVAAEVDAQVQPEAVAALVEAPVQQAAQTQVATEIETVAVDADASQVVDTPVQQQAAQQQTDSEDDAVGDVTAADSDDADDSALPTLTAQDTQTAAPTQAHHAHKAKNDAAVQDQADDLARRLDDTGAQVQVQVKVSDASKTSATTDGDATEMLAPQDAPIQAPPPVSGDAAGQNPADSQDPGLAAARTDAAQTGQPQGNAVQAKPFDAILAAQVEAAAANQNADAPSSGQTQGTQAVAGLNATSGTAATQKAQAPQAAQAARQPQLPQSQEVMDQISVQIAKQSKDGGDTIKVQLKPTELGSIEIKLDVAKDGTVTTVVTADNKDTLDLLKRDQSSLQKALSDAGLKSDLGSMTFNLREGTQQQNNQQSSESRTGRRRARLEAAAAADAASAKAAAAAQARWGMGRSGVDIQV